MASKLDDASKAKLPFGMGEVDLFSARAVIMAITLTFGMMIYSVAQMVGQQFANRVLAMLGQVLPGGNPATATNENAGPAFGGQ
jgi:hypothetical protein